MKLLNYIIAFLLFSIAKAGNNPALSAAKTDFKKVNEMYTRANGLSMDTYYKVFKDHYSQSMLEGKNGAYVKYNKNLYTKIDDIETFSINDKIISINRDNRQITVGDNKLPELSPLQTNVDTLLTLCRDIKMEQINATERKYKLYFESTGTEFSQVDVYIDTKNLKYTKLVLYYSQEMNLQQNFYGEKETPRLEISYRNLKILQSEPAIFNQNLYVLNVNGKLKPAPDYYNFKVSDLRNETRIKQPSKTK